MIALLICNIYYLFVSMIDNYYYYIKYIFCAIIISYGILSIVNFILSNKYNSNLRSRNVNHTNLTPRNPILTLKHPNLNMA